MCEGRWRLWFVSSKFETNVIDPISVVAAHIESLFIEVKSGNVNILLGVYRPPTGNCDSFFESIHSIFNSIDVHKYKEIVLCGDFNFDLLNMEDPQIQLFSTTLHSYSLYPLISKPTRIVANSATLIDNIFITSPVNFIAGSLITTLSDHYSVFMIHKDLLATSDHPSQISYSFRKINHANLGQLYHALALHDFSNVLSCIDVSVAVDEFNATIYYYYNMFCPLINKTVSPKKIIKPWIDSSILSDIKRSKM